MATSLDGDPRFRHCQCEKCGFQLNEGIYVNAPVTMDTIQNGILGIFSYLYVKLTYLGFNFAGIIYHSKLSRELILAIEEIGTFRGIYFLELANFAYFTVLFRLSNCQ